MRKNPPYLPNLLSALRIALAPGLLGAAYSNSKVGFLILLGFAMLADQADGILARRWKAESEMGRQLDRWGDALTMSLGALGIYFLWPISIETEWQAATLALFSYAIIGYDRLWRRADREKVPTWWERIIALLLPLSLIPLIMEFSPWPFRAAAILQSFIALKTSMEGRPRAREEEADESLTTSQERARASAKDVVPSASKTQRVES